MDNLQAFEILSKVTLFKGLPPDALDKMSLSLVPRDYAKNQFVFRRGSPGTALFLLETGIVHISRTSEKGKSLMLAMLSPGDFFGELALLDGKPRSADALAAADSRLHVLGRESFAATLEEFPQASTALVAALVHRLRETNDLVEEAAFLDVPGRLAKTLLGLAGMGQNEPRDPGRLVLNATHNQLADMLGVTRESVSKNLKIFERLGLLRREGRSLVIISPEALSRRAR